MGKRTKWSSKQQVSLAALQAVGDLAHTNMQEIIRKLLSDGFASINGFNISQTAVASGGVNLSVSLGLDSGGMILVESTQTIHIISGSGGWGTPLAAHATLPRYSIVAIKYATRETDSAATWFIDDSTTPATQYQETVPTRIQDYFDIVVVHGTPASSPVKPVTPAGYTKLADILVPAAATTVTTANITMATLPVLPTLAALNTAYLGHTHDDMYYTEAESDTRYAQKSISGIKIGEITLQAAKETTFELVAGAGVTLTPTDAGKRITIGASQGVTDHGALTGLGDDDHTQYLNSARHGAITGNPHSTGHADLTNVLGADPASTDTTKNKHVSNSQTKGWDDHKGITDGNPHGTNHEHLQNVLGADAASTNATQDKHISNAQAKAWEDHRNAATNHVYVGTTAPSPDSYKLWFDSNSGVNALKTYNGTAWVTSGTDYSTQISALNAEVDALQAAPSASVTNGQVAAMAGTSGTPGATNLFVTNNDPRNSNSRTPTTHAGTHAAGQGDAITPAAIGAAAAVHGNHPSNAQMQAMAGTSGTPGDTNKFVTNDDVRMSNARTPTAHAGTHAAGQPDAVTPAAIGAYTKAEVDALIAAAKKYQA